MKIDFRDLNGQLDGYILTLSQGWEEVRMDTQNCQYMHSMTDNITQMAFVLSHWSGRNRDATNFMEEGQCQGSCQAQATQQFSNFKVTTSHVTPHHTDPSGGYPTLTITENGAEKTLFVQYPEWTPTDDITVAGNAVDFAATSGDGTKFEYSKRLYLSESPTLDTAQYYRPNLLGGAIEYDVDLSDVGCGCVSSLSAVRMPVMDNWRDAFHYCDANQMNEPRSHLCPEFDFMQANRHSFHSAAHKCDAPQNGVYTRCDRGGQCSLNPAHLRLDGEAAYGYGS